MLNILRQKSIIQYKNSDTQETHILINILKYSSTFIVLEERLTKYQQIHTDILGSKCLHFCVYIYWSPYSTIVHLTRIHLSLWFAALWGNRVWQILWQTAKFLMLYTNLLVQVTHHNVINFADLIIIFDIWILSMWSCYCVTVCVSGYPCKLFFQERALVALYATPNPFLHE